MAKNVRNVLIVLALAALVVAVPGGGNGANTAGAALGLGFLGGWGWIAYVQYRERRSWLYALGDARRAALYGALGLVVVTLAAGPRLRLTGAGTIAFIALLAVAAYVIFTVVWSARRD